MRSRIVAALAALALLLVGASGIATPAQAAATHAQAKASLYGCPDNGGICGYRDTSFGGPFQSWSYTPVNTCRVLQRGGVAGWPNGSPGNNYSSILLNNSGTGNQLGLNITWYDSWDCTQVQYSFNTTVGIHQTLQLPNLFDIGWGNRISSFRINCPC